MLYITLGMAYILGMFAVKLMTIFMTKNDKQEITGLYKEFKPDKKDFE